MARDTLPTDFVVTVPEIGSFTFAKRTLRLQFAIRAEYARLSEGAPLVDEDEMVASAAAEIKILALSSPDGWDIDGADALDPETYDRVLKVWEALREKEKSFRANGAGGQAPGPGAGGDVRDVVPAQVQPAAE